MQLAQEGSVGRSGPQLKMSGGSLLSQLLAPPRQKHAGLSQQASTPGMGHLSAAGSQHGLLLATNAVTTTRTQQAVQASSGTMRVAPNLGFPRDIEDRFTLGAQVGKGGNGVVRLVFDKATGTKFACKSIKKVLEEGSDKKKANHLISLRQEINVLKKLKGSLNIINIEAVYEDEEYVHIVQEYCAGGELSFAIGQRHYSERTVASYMRAVLRTLAQCHSHNILHRDIKPGNFMLLNEDERSPLRAIDFGLATPFEPEELPLSNLGLEGTPWFMAPEVLSSQVTPASDLWSAGIMAVQLLTGRLPFDDHRNTLNPSITAIWRSILSDKVDFNKPWWSGISQEARDFVSCLLNRDPAARPTAKEALKHPFLAGDSRDRSTGKRLHQSVVARIQRFSAASNFKRSVFKMIAAELIAHPELLPPVCMTDAKGRPLVTNPTCLEPLYQSLKFDHQDEVETEQVAVALRELGYRLDAADLQRVLEQLDPDHTGRVARTAFTATQVDWRHLQTNHKEAWLGLCKRAFATLDRDQDGVLHVDEILKHLQSSLPCESELQQLVQEAMEESGQGMSTHQGMEFSDFMRMLKISSVDSLDMYDDRLGSTMASVSSIDKLNSLLQRAGSMNSLGTDSRHGAGSLLRSLLPADDSQHSTTSADPTNHLYDMDGSLHHSDGRYGGAWRFDVGGASTPSSSSGAASGGKLGAPAWRFDVAGAAGAAALPRSEAMAVPGKPQQQQQMAPPGFFRFDVAGPQSHVDQKPATAPVWRFDVAGPVHAPSPASRDSYVPHGAWRFDTSSPVHAPSDGVAVPRASAGLPDNRHHGSSLYKNSALSAAALCRAADRSVHGPVCALETVQE